MAHETQFLISFKKGSTGGVQRLLAGALVVEGGNSCMVSVHFVVVAVAALGVVFSQHRLYTLCCCAAVDAALVILDMNAWS